MSEAAQPAEPAQLVEHARIAAVEAELSGAERTEIERTEIEQVDAEWSDAEQAVQASGDAPPTPSSADPRVDDALSRLAEIDDLPLTEQVEVYADIHRRLAGVLADPDSQA